MFIYIMPAVVVCVVVCWLIIACQTHFAPQCNVRRAPLAGSRMEDVAARKTFQQSPRTLENKPNRLVIVIATTMISEDNFMGKRNIFCPKERGATSKRGNKTVSN